MYRQRALLIGGGIGGLAAAIGLKKIGYDVQVYEQAPEPREVGAGLTLWSNAVRALEWLGVAEGVRARVLPDMEGSVYTQGGKKLTSLTNHDLVRRFGDYSVAVHRADLHQVLLDALGGDRVTWGRRFVRFEQSAKCVRATFADGSEASGDILIGTDGLHSGVRTQLHGEQKPRYAGYTAWRGVVDFDPAKLLPGESWGYGARFGRVPLPGGRAYWFATRNASEGASFGGSEKAELLRTFTAWHAPVAELIEATDDSRILRNDIYDRPALTRWGEGRVTLLGDAAHPMTPNLGQGACQALEDAVVLANTLHEAEEDAPPVVLHRYERRRYARTRAIVNQSRRVGEIGQWSHPLAAKLRNALISKLPPVVQARQLEQLLRFDP